MTRAECLSFSSLRGMAARDARIKLHQKLSILKRRLDISRSERALRYYCRTQDPERLPR